MFKKVGFPDARERLDAYPISSRAV